MLIIVVMSNRSINEMPIGIFDSGVGGLTVYRALHDRLPNEHFIYLGDTARVPYGTKSMATVERYAIENSVFLASRGIKMLVVACNTASALDLFGLLDRHLPDADGKRSGSVGSPGLDEKFRGDDGRSKKAGG